MSSTVEFMLMSGTRKIELNGFYYIVSNENPKEGEWSYHPLSEIIIEWTSTCPKAMFFFKVVDSNDPKVKLPSC